MKRLIAAGILSAMLCLTGCNVGNAQSDPAESNAKSQEGLTVSASEEVDSAYSDLLKTYFTAVEQKDYETFKKTMYPPYLESFNAYLKEQAQHRRRILNLSARALMRTVMKAGR